MTMDTGYFCMKVKSPEVWDKFRGVRIGTVNLGSLKEKGYSAYYLNDDMWDCDETELCYMMERIARILGEDGVIVGCSYDGDTFEREPWITCAWWCGEEVCAKLFTDRDPDQGEKAREMYELSVTQIPEFFNIGQFHLSDKEHEVLKAAGIQMVEENGERRYSAASVWYTILGFLS